MAYVLDMTVEKTIALAQEESSNLGGFECKMAQNGAMICEDKNGSVFGSNASLAIFAGAVGDDLVEIPGTHQNKSTVEVIVHADVE